MLGEIAALSCAFLFALSSAITTALAHRMRALSLIGWRGLVGLATYLAILTALGRWNELRRMPMVAILGYSGDALLGIVIGGMLFIGSLRLIGVARALPISLTYPVLATLIAVVAFGEPLSWRLASALPLAIAGTWLLGSPTRRQPALGEETPGQPTPKSVWLGAAMALGAAILWALGTNLLKVAVRSSDLVTGAFLQNAVVTIIALALAGPVRSAGEFKSLGRRLVLLLVLAGLLENGLINLLYLFAVQQAGVARTSILNSFSPLFAVPLGVAFLGEHISAKRVARVILCALGAILVFI